MKNERFLQPHLPRDASRKLGLARPRFPRDQQRQTQSEGDIHRVAQGRIGKIEPWVVERGGPFEGRQSQVPGSDRSPIPSVKLETAPIPGLIVHK